MDEATLEDGPQAGARALVVIPTYNERESLARIVGRVRRSAPAAEVLVVDDGSPDGTGDLAAALAAADDHVHLVRRSGKGGLGSAYRAGFRWALAEGRFTAVVEMDADGSHAPEQLDRLLDASADADLVLGSRYVPGGEVVNWPLRRLLLSRGGNRYARACLDLDLSDMTGGYRLFRTDLLAALDIDAIESEGYCFQIEMVRAAASAGFRIVEVPITFTERTTGTSKMSHRIVAEALLRLGRWGVERVTGAPEAPRSLTTGPRG